MTEDFEVIAWDGEGVGHPDHRYVLLGNSLGMELRRMEGLGTLEVLDFVWRTGAAHPDALHVMFGANYDFNNWLKDVDLETARRLSRNHPVTLGRYQVRYNGTWFEVKRGRIKVTIWDVWRFWGTRFDVALEECFPDFHGLGVIKSMKAQRGEFTDEGVDEMSRYNQLELEGLVMMTHQLFKDLAEARIQRPSWLTGSGALAGSLLRTHGVANHNQRIPRENGIYDAVLRAFIAGRVECLRIGTHDGPFNVYDLRSAYPKAMLSLPSMAEGQWTWRDELSTDYADRMSVWNVQWAWDRTDVADLPSRGRFFPFHFRNRVGAIKFPNWGRGWAWWPEVVTARALGFKFQVLGGWTWESSDPEVSPFAWVEDLFYQRYRLRELGRTGAQRELKFALNSLYGKLCQARGSTRHRPPANHNLAWAGWTTSHCRATLLDAMCQAPEHVTFCMTDSIASTVELDLDVGKGLGQWERATYERAQVVQAGVVTLWQGGEPVTEKYRGFDVGTLHADAIEARWRENHATGVPTPLAVPTTRPVTLGAALTSERAFADWNRWITSQRELDVYGGSGKRWRPWDVREKEPWRHLCEVSAWEPLTAADALELYDGVLPLSEPYAPKWADAESRDLEEVLGSLKVERVVEAEADAALLRVRRL